MTIRSLVAGAALFTIAAPLRAQSNPSAVVDRAVAAWRSVKTAQGTFTQTISNGLTGSTASSNGTFVEKRPNKLAINFTNPSGDRIVADGHSLWIYTPSAVPGQVIRRRGASASEVPIDIAAQLTSAKSRYTISDGGAATVDGAAAHVVVLTPREKEGGVSRIKVWVSDRDAMIREFEVSESSGVTRHIHLTSLTVNAPVPNDAFTFTVPAGAKVVE